jgi:hypothetical protein
VIFSRRFALITAAAVLGISACGDPNAQTATSSPSSLPKISIGAAGANASTARGGAESTSIAAGDDYAFGWPIEFVYDGEFPTLATEGTVWQFPAGFQPDVETVRKIADVFGVQGELTELPDDQGGGWVVGPSDYSGPAITVSTDGMGSWWYSAPSTVEDSGCVLYDPAVDVAPGAPTDTPVDPAVTEAAPCPAPQPPVNVPDKEAAKQKAAELLAAMGVSTDGLEWDIYADEWGASVTAFTMLEGLRSGATYSFGFGAEGATTWASGYLAAPQKVGDYPLVGCEAGVARLNDETSQWLYSSPILARGDQAVTEQAGAGVETQPAEAIPADTAVAVPETVAQPDEPQPTDPQGAEKTIVTLSECKIDRTMVYGDDGTVWLLPAYSFSTSDDGSYSVIAVDDSFISRPETPQVEEPTVETLAPSPGPAGPVGPPEVGPPNIDPPSEGTPIDVPAPIDQAVAAEALTGLSEKEAEVVANKNGWTLRVVTRDGESLSSTADYSPTRVNVAVEDGAVTAVESIG